MTACNLLETYVSLFFARIIDLQLSSKEKLRGAKFQKSLDAVDFSAFNISRHISSTHGKSQGKSVQFRHSFICWPVFPELIGSRFSHAKDLRFFLPLQKKPDGSWQRSLHRVVC